MAERRNFRLEWSGAPRALKDADPVAEPCGIISAKFGTIPTSWLCHDSIMTPRIRHRRHGSTPVEIWISKLLSYTMLPALARARSWPARRDSPLLGGHKVKASQCHSPNAPDVARQHPNCGAAPAIQARSALTTTAKCPQGSTLRISIRSARLLRDGHSHRPPRCPQTLASYGKSR
jgi:hypothetical protein